MFSRIKRAFHWARALAVTDPKIAIEHINKMDSLGALRPFERAHKVTLLILADRFDDAETLIDAIARETDEATGASEIYVNLYVRRFRAKIDGNILLAEHLTREALKIDVSKTLRSWLPVA